MRQLLQGSQLIKLFLEPKPYLRPVVTKACFLSFLRDVRFEVCSKWGTFALRSKLPGEVTGSGAWLEGVLNFIGRNERYDHKDIVAAEGYKRIGGRQRASLTTFGGETALIYLWQMTSWGLM